MKVLFDKLTDLYMHVYVYIQIYMHMYIYVYMHIYIHMYVFVCTHIHIDKNTYSDMCAQIQSYV